MDPKSTNSEKNNDEASAISEPGSKSESDSTSLGQEGEPKKSTDYEFGIKDSPNKESAVTPETPTDLETPSGQTGLTDLSLSLGAHSTESENTTKSATATTNSTVPTQPQHSFKMLDTVLEEPPREPLEKRAFRQHMLFDLILAAGLLIAVGGFTVGMMKIYVTHMAKQSITQHNYKAAITILKKNPVPEFFSGFGSDPDELLNQALYLDAMEKLDANPEDQSALAQLGRITAGSRFFHLAQEILDKNTVPSDLKLHGSTSHFASQEESKEQEKKPLFEELKSETED